MILGTLHGFRWTFVLVNLDLVRHCRQDEMKQDDYFEIEEPSQ